jgi:hypothetical protein
MRASLRQPWTIFWAGFALRVAVILIGRTYHIRSEFDHFNFGFEAGRIARSLATGQGYANPFNGPSGPTAWLPPLYPLLLAAVFQVFGVYTRASALAALVCNSAFSAAIAPAVYEIAVRLFDARGLARRHSTEAMPVALWSAWLWAVYPAALQYAVHWVWEMSLSTMLFTWALVAALRLREDRVQGPGQRARQAPSLGSGPWTLRPLALWCGFGLLWGAVALSNASLLICLPPMLLWIVWPELRSWSLRTQTWLGLATTTLVFAAVLTPWVVRNERVMHAFIPTRSNLGIELYASTLESHDALPWGTALPMWAGEPEFRLFVQMGEVRFASMRGEQARERIRANPAQFWRWTLDRFLFFWDGTPHPPDRRPVQEYLRELSYSFLSLCGLLGLGLMLHRRVEGAGLFALVFALQPVPYYLVTVQARFRHPLEPLIAVLAVYLFRSAEQKPVEGRQ